MRGILFILVMMIFTGCHTSKSPTGRSLEQRIKFVADSLKYASVKEAFIKGDFVYKVTMREYAKVNPLDNWYMITHDSIRWQIYYPPTIFSNQRNAHVNQAPTSRAGKIYKREIIYNTKKGTIILKLRAGNFGDLTLTLFEGSDKAFTGYTSGWIEPLWRATIVRGFESPVYK